MHFETGKQREDFIHATMHENPSAFDDKEFCNAFRQASDELQARVEKESAISSTAYDATVHMLQGFFLEAGHMLAHAALRGKDYQPLLRHQIKWILSYASELHDDMVVTLRALENEKDDKRNEKDDKRPE